MINTQNQEMQQHDITIHRTLILHHNMTVMLTLMLKSASIHSQNPLLNYDFPTIDNFGNVETR